MLLMCEDSFENMGDLVAKATELFEKNRKKGTTTLNGETVDYHYTCPGLERYPHQWLWDSSFHAIVLSHFDPERGQEEIETLLKAQREDGFLSIVTLWEGIASLKEYTFIAPYTTGKTQTMTQPPVVALAVEKLYQKTGDKGFLKGVLPGLMRFADYLNTKRDQDGDHLVSVFHAFETGMDMLPAYDSPAGVTSAKPDGKETIMALLRPAWSNYFLDWDEKKMAESGLFNVKDVMFNCIHAQSQRAIARLLKELEDPKSEEYHKSATLTEDAIIAHCWNEDGLFYSLDKDNTQLEVKTITSLFPLILDNVPKDKLDRLVDHLTNPDEFWPEYPVPTVALDEPSFDAEDSEALWRGPTWISTNWFLINGLEKHGYTDIASDLREKTIKLVEEKGFREYFNPLTGEGYGSEDFAWATLAIDLQLQTD